MSNVVEVDRIEKELASMWASTGGEEAGTTRACTLNLIVYATPQDSREELDALLDEVNERAPGRTLILVADRASAGTNLDAFVSARCRLLGDSGKKVCGDEVTISASGSAVDSVATAILPLLVPDVPVYLWWKGLPHPNDQLFDRLARMSDRVIVDSRSFVHPARDLVLLNELIGADRQSIHVSDVNWGRLTPWRSLIASFWDVPEYRPHLAAIDNVKIGYHPPPAAPDDIATKAALMGGWLAERLAWRWAGGTLADSGEEVRCRLRSAEREIALSLRRDCTSGTTTGGSAPSRSPPDTPPAFRSRCRRTSRASAPKHGWRHAHGRQGHRLHPAQRDRVVRARARLRAPRFDLRGRARASHDNARLAAGAVRTVAGGRRCGCGFGVRGDRSPPLVNPPSAMAATRRASRCARPRARSSCSIAAPACAHWARRLQPKPRRRVRCTVTS
jgi:glucose-6-phosphate dehydrogenase assembly protein OpcA